MGVEDLPGGGLTQSSARSVQFSLLSLHILALQVSLSLPTWVLKSPSGSMGSPVRALSNTPSRDSKKAEYCAAVRQGDTSNSKRPVPVPKAQGNELWRVQPLSRRWVPEPMLCLEVSPTITTITSASQPPAQAQAPQRGHIPCPYSKRLDARVGLSRPPAVTAAQTSLNLPLLDLPTGG